MQLKINSATVVLFNCLIVAVDVVVVVIDVVAVVVIADAEMYFLTIIIRYCWNVLHFERHLTLIRVVTLGNGLNYYFQFN